MKILILSIITLVLTMLTEKVNTMELSKAKSIKESQQPKNPIDTRDVLDESDEVKKQFILKRFEKLFGIRGKLKEDNRTDATPQFMMELYNTVTDEDGRMRENNPYNAKIVRSFIERDSSSSYFYIFNVTGLEKNESVLEAELHLYQKPPSYKTMNPSILSSPYYLIKVYQVLPNKSLNEPDLHKLLNVHYVGAYVSGWQVFNVKQAVLSWLTGTPNLGLLVYATTIFGNQVTVDFYRRHDEPNEKQPILVLFNDDNIKSNVHIYRESTIKEENDEFVEREKDIVENKLHNETTIIKKERSKRDDKNGISKSKGQLEEMPNYVENNRPKYFFREKKLQNKDRENYNAGEIVSKKKSLEHILTSMDIYQRAILREKLNQQKRPNYNSRKVHQSTESSRTKRDVTNKEAECRKVNSEPCSRREMVVDFVDIGLTTIIAPPSYSAYQCQGNCKSPLSQEQKPTNHAMIQGIIHKMNLEQDVEMPCCVPIKLSSISILYLDEETGAVMLKSYSDMKVESCGCR